MNHEQKQEFTRRISQANETEMVVVLYDMLLEYLKETEKQFLRETKENTSVEGSEADWTQVHLCIDRARACLRELIQSLHMEYAPAKEMYLLYQYCIRVLAICDSLHEKNRLQEIVHIIQPLREAYAQIAVHNTSGPVMGNSQSVVAGLTYGREQLNENMLNSGNRGFFA